MQEPPAPTAMEGLTYTQGSSSSTHETHGDDNTTNNPASSTSTSSSSTTTNTEGGSPSSHSQTIQKITPNPATTQQSQHATSSDSTTNPSPSSSHSPTHNGGDKSPKHSPSPDKESKETSPAGENAGELEQFQDRSPIQTPISYTQDTKGNSSGKRPLESGIPTELDSNKIKKKNELLMNEANEKLAAKILSSLLKNPWAPPFENPVDPEALGLPDYFDIVKRPMDLGTIATNLTDKKYSNVSNFGDDVRLVFSNAMLYNENGSAIHKAARNFLTEFDGLMRSTPWVQVYDNKIPEVTTPIVTISKKPTPTKSGDVTHIEEPKTSAITRSPPSPHSSSSSKLPGRNGSHSRSGHSKHGYNCLVYYQNETIPYDFEWHQLHSREEFEQKLRTALSIPSLADLEIGIKRSKPNFGREVFVQLSPRWEEFPKVSCVLVKHRKL